MSSCNIYDTPMLSSPQLIKVFTKPFKDPTLYHRTIGTQQYVTLTRQFAVNCLCQFMHAPNIDHWKVVKCLLYYLKAISTIALVFIVTMTLTYTATLIVTRLVALIINDQLLALALL